MRCNACWRELEGRAVSTTCGHILCTEDASKILSNDGACPMCDQVLSKSVLKPVDINPNDEWTNMAMTGVSPQTLMKSAYRSVMFYIGQKELEMQYKMNRVVAQYRQKFEAMQEKFTEKLEQVHTAYQKMAKKCHMLEQEVESLSKDKQELQEKFAEESRQKRKLEEMYDQLRNDFESAKRSAIQPTNSFFSRNENDLFFNRAAVMMDGRDPMRKDCSVHAPPTPGPREGIWPTKQNSSWFGQFDIGGGSPTKQGPNPADHGNRRTNVHSAFGAGSVNPSTTLRNLILSPIKQPQLSCNRPQMFTL